MKVVCEIVAESSVKRASVRVEGKGAASSDVRRGVCKDQARSSVQASRACPNDPDQWREREGER